MSDTEIFLDALRRHDMRLARTYASRIPPNTILPGVLRLPPLHYVINQESLSLIEPLLARGADVNFRDAEGNTALMSVLEWNPRPQIVLLLLEAGGDPNIPNARGITPFRESLQNGLTTISLLLLAFGGNKTMPPIYGLTIQDEIQRNMTRELPLFPEGEAREQQRANYEDALALLSPSFTPRDLDGILVRRRGTIPPDVMRVLRERFRLPFDRRRHVLNAFGRNASRANGRNGGAGAGAGAGAHRRATRRRRRSH